MGNPCQSCHGRPETSFGPLELDLTACPAEKNGVTFPPSLFTPEAESAEARPAQVRSRFEAARRALHPEGSPVTIDLNRAEFDATLVPKTFQVSLPWGLKLQLVAGRQAKVSAQGSIRDNALDLGLRSLVEFFQITLKGPNGLSTTPDRISVGNHGHLHLLTSVKPELYEQITREPGINPSLAQILLEILQSTIPIEFNFPPEGPAGNFPLGYDKLRSGECSDEIPPEETQEEGTFSTTIPLEYPDPQKNPKLDFILTHLLPAALLPREGTTLPPQFDLNKLLDIVSKWARQPKDSEHTLKMFLHERVRLENGTVPQEWIDLIEKGSVTLDLTELRDFYLPGIIDLGSSHALLQLKLNPDHSIDFFVENFSLNLDAMDYLPDTSGQGKVQLHDGRVASAQAVTDPQGNFWYPGIQLHWDANHQTLQLKSNLEVKLHATLPFVGEIQISSPLQWGSSWQNIGGWHLVPESNSLQIPQLKIQRLLDGVPTPEQTGEFSITLSDRSASDSVFYKQEGQRSRDAFPEELVTGGGDIEAPSESELAEFMQGQNIPHLNTEIRGKWGDTSLHWRGYVPLEVRAPGGIKRYLPWHPKNDLELYGTLELSPAGQNPLSIHVDTETFQPASLEKHADSDFGVRVNFGVEDHRGEWLIDGARLTFQKVRTTEPSEKTALAPSLQCESPQPETFFTSARENVELLLVDFAVDNVDIGPLHLQDLRLETEIEQQLDKAWSFRIPRLKLKANELASPQNPQQGWIAGAVNIKQTSTTQSPLDVSFDTSSWTINLQNLNLQIALASLALPQKWQDGQQERIARERSSGRTPRPIVTGLGADFRLKGDFEFNLKDLSGTGDLALVGDRDGDIYLHKKNGDRVYPPLRKNTSFRVSDIDQVLIEECNAEGRFREYAEWDTKSLSLVGINLLVQTQEALPFKDLPLCVGGITSANEDYYHQLMLSLSTGHYAPFYQQLQQRYEALVKTFLPPPPQQTQEGAL